MPIPLIQYASKAQLSSDSYIQKERMHLTEQNKNTKTFQQCVTRIADYYLPFHKQGKRTRLLKMFSGK